MWNIIVLTNTKINLTVRRVIHFTYKELNKLKLRRVTVHLILYILLGLINTQVVEGAGIGTLFCYDDPSCGPDTWGQVSPLCQYGNFQSPINLELSKVKKIPKSVNLVLSKEYAYVQSPFQLRNNGHSVSLTLNDEATSPCLVKGNGFLPNEPYFFSSFHFHWGQDDFSGSEHTIDGKAFPLELHMIHKQSSNPNKLAVFGILYQMAPVDNPALNPIIENLYLVKNYDTAITISPAYYINLTDFLPRKVKAFRYQGSLTTPTCDEGVIWTVFDEIQTVSRRQVMAFREILQRNGKPILKNFRPVQPTYTNQRKNIFYIKTAVRGISNVKRNYG